MKASALVALPEGTVILLRPSGPGAREKDAEDGLTLATLGPATPLDRLGYGRYSGIPGWVPEGYIPHAEGQYRAITITHILPYDAPSDAADAWRTPFSGEPTRTAVLPRGVIGVWEDVRDTVLAARRTRMRERIALQGALQAREDSEREQTRRAVEAIRPYMEAAGLAGHPAFSDAPFRPRFTAMEVEALIEQVRAEERSRAEGRGE